MARIVLGTTMVRQPLGLIYRHAARALAEEYFDASRVLSSLIERALQSEPSRRPASTLGPASGAFER